MIQEDPAKSAGKTDNAKLPDEELWRNPRKTGAEGVRRKPNLSGKRTERACSQAGDISRFIRQSFCRIFY